jgi:hypothetical protein
MVTAHFHGFTGRRRKELVIFNADPAEPWRAGLLVGEIRKGPIFEASEVHR